MRVWSGRREKCLHLKRVVPERQRLAVVAVFGKDDHGSELLCPLPHEAGIVGKCHDVALVTRVEEDDSLIIAPVIG